ncbi:hypothetical protein JHK87_033455 [Glycine soja]|nr:hypothetical protein JHK87_033455 [Glycine soja]
MVLQYGDGRVGGKVTHMADGVINDVKQWEMVSFGLGIRVWRWLGAKMSFEKMESTNKLVLSFLPFLVGLYLSRIHSLEPPSLAGFEAILLLVYAAKTKSRNDKPLLITIPKPNPQTLNLPHTSLQTRKPTK